MRKVYLAVLLAGLATASTHSIAMQADAPQPAITEATIDLSDANLLKFSIAMDSIQQIGAKYETEFQNAADPEQAQKLQQQAQSEMVAAVEAAGLTTEQYNAIAQQAQIDEALRKKILDMSDNN
ncbi:DUF4168 domain-containing protein [Chromatiaceae bacterium AAb-1]|jgi:hypothetical protein|nr:DUF4168 domain-containing protein [Chromatiaceae bacterium AAb-1]